jgi:hypothetical protein
LQDLEQVEANCLLNLDGRTLGTLFPDVPHMDVAAMPEIRHILLLLTKQVSEALRRDTIHRPLGATTKLIGRGRMRGVVDHKLCEVDRLAGPCVDPESHLTEVIAVSYMNGI